MSAESSCRNLLNLNLPVGKNDRKWFPKWIRRYASGLRKGKSETLPVEEAEVIRYLQSLRDHGVPAWQRLQAARAVEAYRKHISESVFGDSFKVALRRVGITKNAVPHSLRAPNTTEKWIEFQHRPSSCGGLC